MDIDRIFKRNEEGVWIDFCPGVRIRIKPVSPQARIRFLKQCTSKYFMGGKPAEEVDFEEFNTLLALAAVCDWGGIKKGGKAFPCTPENIKLLMDNWTEFNAFVQGAAINIERYIGKQEEQAAKN